MCVCVRICVSFGGCGLPVCLFACVSVCACVMRAVGRSECVLDGG